MATTLMSRVLKKASGSSSVVIQLANRRTTHHRKYTTAILTFMTSTTSSNTVAIDLTHRHFSALAEKRSNSADDTFLSVIESQIHCAEEKFHQFAAADQTPRNFPFKIDYNNTRNPRAITLTRAYEGEEINVEVNQTYCIDKENDQCVYLNGCVSNKNGLDLKFSITAGRVSSKNGAGRANGNDAADEIFEIDRLDVKNASDEYMSSYGRKFSELDEKLQKGFRKYLEVRGIEPSITKFLYECVAKKMQPKYTGWLNNLKKFVANSN